MNSLNVVVEKIIVPKYPWIKGFEWEKNEYDSFDEYWLKIFPEPDFLKGEKRKFRQLELEIEKEVASMFKILAPASNEHFEGVTVWR